MTFIFLLLAVIVQTVVLLALAVPFALPRVEAWQAAALLLFFLSFLWNLWPWPARNS